MKYQHLVSAMALVAGGGLSWAAGGCALVVGADFGERTVGEVVQESDPCYTGPEGTKDVGLCKAGRIEGDVCVGEVTPAPEVCASPEDESCDGAPGCSGELSALQSFGNELTDTEPRVVVDAEGFIYLMLEATGPVEYGGMNPVGTAGLRSIRLVKLDPALRHVWSMEIGGGDDSIGRGLALDAGGNVVIAGSFRRRLEIGGLSIDGDPDANWDMFVAKIDGEGSALWANGWIGPDEGFANNIVVGSDGGIAVAGGFRGTHDFGSAGPLASAGDRDVFVAKLDADGGVTWARSFGDPSYQEAFGVALGPMGEVALAGTVRGGLDFYDGAPLAASLTFDNGFLAVLEADGATRWSRGFVSETGRAFPIDVAVDPGGRVLVTGLIEAADIDYGMGDYFSFAGFSDAFLAAYPLIGSTPLWARSYGDAYGQVGYRLTVDLVGQVLLAGAAESVIRFEDQDLMANSGYDAFVVKLAPATNDGPGAVIWEKLIGQEGYQSALDVAHGPFGGVVSTGYTDSDFKIGVPGVAHEGGGDVWIAAFLP